MWNPSNKIRHPASLFAAFGLAPTLWFLFHIYWGLLIEAAWQTPYRIGWNWTTVVFAIGSSLLVGILTFLVFRGNPDYMKTWKLTVAIAILAGFAAWLGLFIYSIKLERTRIDEEYQSIAMPCQMVSFPRLHQRNSCKSPDALKVLKSDNAKRKTIEPTDAKRDLVKRLRDAEKVRRNFCSWFLERIRIRRREEDRIREINKTLDRDPEFSVNNVYYSWWPDTLRYYQNNYASDVVRSRQAMLEIVPEAGANSRSPDFQNPKDSMELNTVINEFSQLTDIYKKKVEDEILEDKP
jgi:hypothetical protein